MRSRRNALKHGLATTLMADPEMAKEVSAVAAAMAGEAHGDAAVLTLASAVAEAELDLVRVRLARVQLLNSLAADPGTFVPKLPKELTPNLIEIALAPATSDHPLFLMAQSWSGGW